MTLFHLPLKLLKQSNKCLVKTRMHQNLWNLIHIKTEQFVGHQSREDWFCSKNSALVEGYKLALRGWYENFNGQNKSRLLWKPDISFTALWRKSIRCVKWSFTVRKGPCGRKDSAYSRAFETGSILGVIHTSLFTMKWTWACQYIAQVSLAK